MRFPSHARPAMIAVALVCCTFARTSLATHPYQQNVTVLMTGAQEVADDGTLGVGDPDGFAVAELRYAGHDDLQWRIDYQNISGERISGFHIHGPGATPTTNRPVLVDLLAGEVQGDMTLPNGSLEGFVIGDATFRTTLLQVFDNPAGHYLNLHTSGAGGFPTGAVRGQLPEPGLPCVLTAAVIGLLRRGRRR